MQVTAETPGEWGCPEPGLWDKAHRRLRDRSTHIHLSQKWVKWRLVSPESFPTACGCSHPCWHPTGTMIRRMLSVVFQHFYFLKGNVQSIFHGDENYTRNHLLYSGRGIIVLSFFFLTTRTSEILRHCLGTGELIYIFAYWLKESLKIAKIFNCFSFIKLISLIYIKHFRVKSRLNWVPSNSFLGLCVSCLCYLWVMSSLLSISLFHIFIFGHFVVACLF